ncbi:MULTISPECIES: DUF397 domain-containing protein [unclassified Streptomyces]|uniref:DUF397 domain-containing protein n=1 Tax=unclassified Streptomyces TaxID=2593676 RepID=UPI0023668882|nr:MULTISPECIES: DUF397 domain-containing protein [unclassified Streptomyces]MDF3142891.1 DUF397 domain-containing protein [Streptomyces sp. T21Q-yed]WDF39300.1 DUF397 domain-containing protein [Streptomyces sp. T12]
MKHTPDLSTADWRKSSYSEGGANNCVEVADGYAGVVPVRDSKVPHGGVLVFGASSWSAFVHDVKGSS